jgi:hypothetical protein
MEIIPVISFVFNPKNWFRPSINLNTSEITRLGFVYGLKNHNLLPDDADPQQLYG